MRVRRCNYGMLGKSAYGRVTTPFPCVRVDYGDDPSCRRWVGKVLDVAHSIEDERPQEAARVVHVSHGALSSAEPVRVPIAARILVVSDKTVRAWAEDGLLKPRAVRPRLLLDAERLHTVLHFLDDLRTAGQNRAFRDNLWNRLQDEALLDRADLAESLSEMNAGNVRPALTSDEERKGRRNRR